MPGPTRYFTLFLASTFGFTTSAFALNGIKRPYQSVRSAAMGGVRMTTGLYDENFFNNPARVTANPSSKLTVLQLTPLEVNPATIKNASALLSGKDTLETISDAAGSNLHDRLQFILPAYYLTSNEDRKMAFAFGIIGSVQIDGNFRQSYQTSMEGIADVGPALTVGRKFLNNDDLSVGATAHLIYRMGTSPSYSLQDYVRGVPLSFSSVGGEGAMVDFDLGATYHIIKFASFDFNVGAAAQNILGGSYSNIGIKLAKINAYPQSQPRSFGLGFSANRQVWGPFTDTTIAIEATDIGNNPNGSFFKLLHLGGETHWHFIAMRFGLNQGYLSGGLGFDFHYLTLDFTTYGEELGLNVGTFEDRRYTMSLGFHI